MRSSSFVRRRAFVAAVECQRKVSCASIGLCGPLWCPALRLLGLPHNQARSLAEEVIPWQQRWIDVWASAVLYPPTGLSGIEYASDLAVGESPNLIAILDRIQDAYERSTEWPMRAVQ